MTTDRALWVTAEPPSVHGGGGNIRQAHLLGRLAATVPTDLLVVGAGTDSELAETLGAVTEFAPLPVRTPAVWSRRLTDLTRALSQRASAERLENARHVRVLEAPLQARARYDLIIVEHLGLRDLSRDRRPGERWVLSCQNVRSVTYAQGLAQLQGRRAWLAKRSVVQARRFERTVHHGFDRVLTVSADDAAALPFATTVVPNGVDTSRFTPSPLPQSPAAIFSGSFSYAPNVEAAVWLCDEIWPAVRARVPHAVLRLVGRDPVDTVRALGDRPGVEVAWNVPDILPFLLGARLSVVPLTSGSGTRLKALEAMAAGRPLVGTSVGLAGLGLVDGRHALIRDDTEGLADGIARLLEDDPDAVRLTSAARDLAGTYDWAAIGDQFLAAVL
jgi:glycosyltransferase involved in cell wall biosynthesis